MFLNFLTRSSIGGWVLKRLINLCPVSGLTIKRWLAAGLTFIGTMREACYSFTKALDKPLLSPVILAPVMSARYSLDLDTAICTNIAASGPSMIIGSMA